MNRKRNLPWCFLAVSISAIGLLFSPAATLPRQAEVLQLLQEKRFGELEQIAGDLRREKLEFYKGSYHLDDFYDRFLISRRLTDNDWDDHVSLVKQWAAAHPDSPTPLIALGNIYTSYAWKARGSGYADTVTEDAWRLFRERLLAAKQAFESAEAKPVQDPAAYCNHITVAMGLSQPKEEIDVLFKKGVALEPNYLGLYRAKAYYLLPRWLGEPGDWEAFAEEAANARGGEEGDMLYVIIARSQADTEGVDLFRNTRLSYTRMKRGFEVMLKRNPDYLWDVNSFCYFACIGDDRPQAKELFQRIKGQWEREVWENEGTFRRWENWAVHGGPAPYASSRYQPVPYDPTVVRNRAKAILLIGGVIWLVVVAAIAVGVWFLARNYRKSG